MRLSQQQRRAIVTGTPNGHELLRDVAIQSLQEAAGYMPPTLPESAYIRQVNDARPVTPSRSTSQLYRMLLGDFQFSHTFPEWCLQIAKHGMRIPSEMIPALLNSNLIYPKWREIALLAMGSYARWVVAHNLTQVNWRWVKETPTPTVAQIHQQIDSQSEEWIQRYESNDYVNFHRSFATYHFPWNNALAQQIIRHVDYLIQSVPSDKWRLDIFRIHLGFAYYAPLSYHETYQQYLDHMQVKQITDFDMRQVTAYRKKLRHIITEDAITLGKLKDRTDVHIS